MISARNTKHSNTISSIDIQTNVLNERFHKYPKENLSLIKMCHFGWPYLSLAHRRQTEHTHTIFGNTQTQVTEQWSHVAERRMIIIMLFKFQSLMRVTLSLLSLDSAATNIKTRKKRNNSKIKETKRNINTRRRNTQTKKWHNDKLHTEALLANHRARANYFCVSIVHSFYLIAPAWN